MSQHCRSFLQQEDGWRGAGGLGEPGHGEDGSTVHKSPPEPEHGENGSTVHKSPPDFQIFFPY